VQQGGDDEGGRRAVQPGVMRRLQGVLHLGDILSIVLAAPAREELTDLG
jgi:hypothetical protein